jgi:hypothetical protein
MFHKKETLSAAERAKAEALISLLRQLDRQQQVGFLLMVEGAALLHQKPAPKRRFRP